MWLPTGGRESQGQLLASYLRNGGLDGLINPRNRLSLDIRRDVGAPKQIADLEYIDCLLSQGPTPTIVCLSHSHLHPTAPDAGNFMTLLLKPVPPSWVQISILADNWVSCLTEKAEAL